MTGRSRYDCLVAGRGVLAGILVGTDGSARAEEAVGQAVRFASITAATLEILFVIDTGRPHDEDLKPVADAALAKAIALANEAGVEADARIVAGDPATKLMAEADDRGADLLCVGPDAGLVTSPPRIGRVASRVLREAPCSVLVARSIGTDFPNRIVCGIDGSEDSADLAAFAVAIAAAAQGEIRLVHVIPVLQSRARGRSIVEGLTSPELERSIGEATARGVVQMREVARGRADRRLVRMTKRDGSDLLVVGHRGVRGVHRMLLGSVSEYSAYKARCSVLVSRPVELREPSS
jgi:nucleotide-binding universal stress UspA family protein